MAKASFVGKHNKIKALSLLLLIRPDRGLTCAELAAGAGTTVDSMYVLLGRWRKWRLVKRYKVPQGNTGKHTRYEYVLTSKSKDWLNRHVWDMPLDTWLFELPQSSIDMYDSRIYKLWCSHQIDVKQQRKSQRAKIKG